MLNRVRDLFTKRMRKDWVEAQNKTKEHTPDWWNISQFRLQLYFAYGNEMPERREYDNLIGTKATQYGVAFTARPMTVLSFDGGSEASFPIALEEEFKYNTPRAPYTMLKGELMAIPPENFIKMDEYYANGKVFLRKRTKLIIPILDRKLSKQGIVSSEGVGIAPAWTYVGIEKYWHEHLDGGYSFRPAPTFNDLFVREYYFYGSYSFSPNQG